MKNKTKCHTVRTVLKQHTVRTVLKYHTVRTVLKCHTVRTVLKYHTVRTVLKYHTVRTVLKCHPVRTVPKYHTVRTVLRSNIKIVERCKIDASNSQIHDRSFYCLSTCTSIISSEVNLLWAQAFPLSELMRTNCCNSHNFLLQTLDQFKALNVLIPPVTQCEKTSETAYLIEHT